MDFDSNGAALSIVSAWKDLYDKGYAPNVGVGGDAGLTDFSAGKAAITLGSTASLKQILNDVNGSFEVGTAYFPSIKDADQGGVSIGGASLWAIQNQDDVKAQATWKFVEYLVSAESQAYWAPRQDISRLPTLRTIRMYSSRTSSSTHSSRPRSTS